MFSSGVAEDSVDTREVFSFLRCGGEANTCDPSMRRGIPHSDNLPISCSLILLTFLTNLVCNASKRRGCECLYIYIYIPKKYQIISDYIPYISPH